MMAKTRPAMSGAEIARELHITRQDVSQILKRGLGKVFWSVKAQNPDQSDFDNLVEIALMLEVEQSDEELSKLYRLFPEDIKALILKSALEQYDKTNYIKL